MEHAQKPIKRFSMEKQMNRVGLCFVLPFFLIFGVFNLFPVLYSFVLSLFSWDGIGEKSYVGFQNYQSIITNDPYFWKSLGNTVLIILGYLPVTLVLGLLVSVLLFNKHIIGRRFFQTAQFLPYVVVPVACGLLFMLMFDWGTGVINRFLVAFGIVDKGINWLGSATTARLVLMFMQVWRLLGYIVTIYLAGLTNISPELMEAAEIDGANQRQVIRHIIVPLLKNTTLFLSLTSLIDGLQLFDAPKVLFTTGQVNAYIGGPDRSCLTPVWYMYDQAFGNARMGYGAAIAYCLFVIIVITSVVQFVLTNRGGDNA